MRLLCIELSSCVLQLPRLIPTIVWSAKRAVLFFFKQETAYEMRMSDLSSDVCSADLIWPQAHWPYKADPALEKRIAGLLQRMTVEEKVGQVVQADIASVTPADVKQYHLGSVLNGGSSGPDRKSTRLNSSH